LGEKLNFEIDKLELVEEVSNSSLAKIRMFIVSEGNNHHNMPISWDCIELSKTSLIGKPVLCKYNEKTQQFEGHEFDEIPVGVFLKLEEIYEEKYLEKRWLVADAYIWKNYFPHIMDVFKKQDGESNVSMEISVLESAENELGQTEIKLFAFQGVTLIGKSPAVENAHAQVLKFSEMVKETEKILQSNFQQNHSSNENLNSDNAEVDVTLTIHNESKEDEMMLFNKEEFAKNLNLTANEIYEKLEYICGSIKYKEGEYEYSRYYMRDYSSEYVYAYDRIDNKVLAIPYSVLDGEFVVDFEQIKSARLAYVLEEEGEADFKDALMELLLKLVAEKEMTFNSEKETLEKQFNEVKDKFSELENEKLELNGKLENFSNLENEIEALKQFKANVEETEKKNKIEFAIQTVIDDLNQEQVNEWKNKVNEFESVDAFTNAIQSFAYSLTKNKKGKRKEEFDRISLPAVNQESETKSENVWDRLKNNK
jgi:hypothetical protein